MNDDDDVFFPLAASFFFLDFGDFLRKLNPNLVHGKETSQD